MNLDAGFLGACGTGRDCVKLRILPAMAKGRAEPRQALTTVRRAQRSCPISTATGWSTRRGARKIYLMLSGEAAVLARRVASPTMRRTVVPGATRNGEEPA